MKTPRLPSLRLVSTAGIVALTACTGSSAGEPGPTAPPPSAGTTVVAETDDSPTSTADTTTSSAPATVADTTPDTEPPDTEPVPTVVDTEGFLPDDLGTRVDSAPGATTPGEVIELLDNVWIFIPSEPDPDDPNVIPPLPEDVPIIAAYARAMTALYEQVIQDPVSVEPSPAMQEHFLDGGETYSENVFAGLNSNGEHLELFSGDTLRPVVLADPRSDDEAFIFDCLVGDSKYVTSTGDLRDGEVAGTVESPLAIRLANNDGEWIVTNIQEDERACV